MKKRFNDLPKRIEKHQKKHKQRFNMSGYAAPKISTVRIGIIGTGNRGSHHAGTISRISDVEIKAAADVLPERFERIKKNLEKTDHNPEYYSGSDDAWKELCERKDLDLVLITTPTYLHAKMAVYAMEQGKHVITEVPAAVTIEGCWDIVKTSEKTKKHCMMMENYTFMPLSYHHVKHGQARIFWRYCAWRRGIQYQQDGEQLWQNRLLEHVVAENVWFQKREYLSDPRHGAYRTNDEH